MKVCRECPAVLEEPVKPGQGGRCRPCKNAYQNARRAANREEVREKARAYYAANVERERQRQKEYRENHVEQRKELWQNWYHNNLEYQKERQKIYREENREHVQEIDRQRYTKDPHVRARRLIQQRVQKGRMPKASECPCTDCGQTAAEYDHYLGYEGAFASMVQPVCKPCHYRRTEVRKCPSTETLESGLTITLT
jgi:hypothetical protein